MGMYKDSLYRVSFKCLIRNEDGKVLVAKERDRSSWDLPGGGIEFEQTIEESIARELYEEVAYEGNFGYRVIKIQDPVKLLTRDVWQITVIVLLEVSNYDFSAGDDADDLRFIDPDELKDSDSEAENRISEYHRLAFD